MAKLNFQQQIFWWIKKKYKTYDQHLFDIDFSNNVKTIAITVILMPIC